MRTPAAVGMLALAAVAIVLAVYVGRSGPVAPGPSPTVAAQTAPPAATTAATAAPAPTETASPRTTSPAAPVTASAQAGAITGRMGYPSEFIPEQTVYAISTTDARIWYSVRVPRFPPPNATPRQGTFAPGEEPRYTITGVAPGTYYVVAYRDDRELEHLVAVYSRSVACANSGASPCPDDHSPAPVTVRAGETTSRIDMTDWRPIQQTQPTIPPRPTPR